MKISDQKVRSIAHTTEELHERSTETNELMQRTFPLLTLIFPSRQKIIIVFIVPHDMLVNIEHDILHRHYFQPALHCWLVEYTPGRCRPYVPQPSCPCAGFSDPQRYINRQPKAPFVIVVEPSGQQPVLHTNLPEHKSIKVKLHLKCSWKGHGSF